MTAAVAAAAGIGAPGMAQAAESQPGPVVTWVTRPVDPQPVVAGHEGDILLEVNVVMAGTGAAPATPQAVVKAAKTNKAAKTSKAKNRR